MKKSLLVIITTIIICSAIHISVSNAQYIKLKLPTYGIFMGVEETEGIFQAVFDVQCQEYRIEVSEDFIHPNGWVGNRQVGSVNQLVFCLDEFDKIIDVRILE